MIIPFSRPSYRRDRTNLPPTVLRNFLLESDGSGGETETTMLVQRPGLTRFATLPSAIRGMFYARGGPTGMYAISGNTLYRVDVGANSVIGTLDSSSGLVDMAANFDRIAIVAAGSIFIYGASSGSTNNTFRKIVVPDGFTAVSVAMLNDYFVFACQDGTFYWLRPGDDDWSSELGALQFATAESDPDGLVAVRVLNGNLFFFGSATIEVWQTQSSADAPFLRATGQDYARGCLSLSSVENVDNALFWVGDDMHVYRSEAVPLKISTASVDERLRLRTGPPSAWTFSYDSHLIYCLNIPGQGTWIYDVASKAWSEFISEGADHWRAIVGVTTPSGTYCGDDQSGAIWTLSDSSQDDGEILRRTATATVAVTGAPRVIGSIVFDVGSAGPCTWNYRYADADQPIDDQAWIPLHAAGGSEALTDYRLDAARSPYRTFQIEVSDPVGVRLSGARVGEGQVWR